MTYLEEFAFTLKKDLWCELEIRDLFDSKDIGLLSLMRAAVAAGTLTAKATTDINGKTWNCFIPVEVIKWAMGKVPIPDGLLEWYNEKNKPTQEQEKPFSETERDKLLKQIGVMALVLAEKNGKYRLGEKPNASQIAIAVQSITDGFLFTDKKGTGSTEMRGSISAGLQLLQNDD